MRGVLTIVYVLLLFIVAQVGVEARRLSLRRHSAEADAAGMSFTAHLTPFPRIVATEIHTYSIIVVMAGMIAI